MIYSIFGNFYCYGSSVGTANNLGIGFKLSYNPFSISFGINSSRFNCRLAGRLIKCFLKDKVRSKFNTRAFLDRIRKGFKH